MSIKNMDIAEVQGETLGIVFVDVVSAFPSLMRSLALDTVGGDEAQLQRLKALGFDGADIAAIKLDITSTPWMTGQVTARQAQMLGTLHSFTWTTVDGTEGILRTHRGTAAGLPLSDAIFIAALGRAVANIEQRLEEEHLISDACLGEKHRQPELQHLFGTPQAVPLKCVGFVDDLAFPVLVQPQGVKKALATMAEIIADGMCVCGFHLNASKTKNGSYDRVARQRHGCGTKKDLD